MSRTSPLNRLLCCVLLPLVSAGCPPKSDEEPAKKPEGSKKGEVKKGDGGVGNGEAKNTATNAACVPQDPTGTQDIPFPLNGFDYKTALATNRGGAGRPLRAHGWNLFEAINRSSMADPTLPVWRTWATAYPAYRPYPPPSGGPIGATKSTTLRHKNSKNGVLATTAAPKAGASQSPPITALPAPLYQVPKEVCADYGYPQGTGVGQCPGPADPSTEFTISEGDMFQNNGDIMLVAVVYNPPAYNWIRDQKLYSAATLDAKKSGGAKKIDEFPNGSTVLKNMYWPVAGDAYTALPLWTNPAGIPAEAYLGYETWTTAVAIRGEKAPAPPSSGTIDVSYLQGIDSWYPTNLTPKAPLHPAFTDAPIHELDEFNYRTLSQADLDALCVNDRAILDQSSIWAFGRPFEEGDSIVQMAVHIIVKEMPNEATQSGWSFQTFWWADKNPRSTGPNNQDFGAGRPAGVPAGYYMMVDDGLESPDVPGTWAAHYNPFIEPVIHPVQTSCQNCHARAAWPSKAHYQQQNGAGSGSAGTEYGAYQLADIAADPGLLEILYPDNSINAQLMTADYMWAVVDRAH